MSYTRRALVFLSLLCLLVVPGRAAVESPASGVLLLRNGRVLQGGITRVGDRYLVTLGETDEVGVPVAEVKLACGSLDEAYRIQLDEIDPNRIEQQLDLADWCLREGLHGRAAEQLIAAMRLDAQHPRVTLFERRLHLAAESSRRVVTERPVPEDTELAATAPVIHELPPLAVEEFTTAIQPLLLNRCGAGGCHGTNTKSDYQLTRPTWTRTLPRGFTQKNLQSTLAWIDRSQPEASPILTVLRGNHGGRDEIFSPREQHQYQQLLQWVLSTSQANPAAQRPEIIRQPPMVLQQPGGAPSRSVDTPPAVVEPPDDTTTHKPGDPFDPEVFNRRFR